MKMIGTIWWNVIGGSVTFLSTFLVSIQSNLITTSLIKSLYSFAVMFVLMFLIRWVFGLLNMKHSSAEEHETAEESQQPSAPAGQHIDLVTPDESANDPQPDEVSFTPLNPPKLETKKVPDPERMAQAVCHLSAD